MTNGSGTTTREVEAYLASVRAALADLPDEERRELLEDLELHLAEVASSDDRGDRPLAAVLGSPESYAAELRVAAGYSPAPSAHEDGLLDDGVWSALARRVGRSRAGQTAARVWAHSSTAEARAFVPELRPAWWVLRGFLVVALPAWWKVDSADDFPMPSVFGSQIWGAVFVAVAVVVSVRVGRESMRLPWVRPGLVNAVLIVGVLSLLPHVDTRMLRQQYVSSGSPSYPPYELTSAHGPITNIYPYGADGKPLENVLLYDQDGRPLRVADQQWWPDGCPRVPDHPRAADGIAVEFAYPRRYVVAQPGPYGPPSHMAHEGSCTAVISRPSVPLPAFPAATEGG